MLIFKININNIIITLIIMLKANNNQCYFLKLVKKIIFNILKMMKNNSMQIFNNNIKNK